MAKKFYEIFGLKDGASIRRVEHRYKTLLKDIFLDKKSSKHELDQKRQEMSDAINFLRDEEKKRQYDAGLINEKGKPVGEKEKNYMGLVEKYYDFLNQAIDDFTYVKARPGVSKENREFLESQIIFFRSLLDDLEPLGELARDKDAYNAKYESIYPKFREGLASAWRQIYQLSATEPNANKSKPDHMPTPQDYKLVASKLMPDWKISDNPFAHMVVTELSVTTPEHDETNPSITASELVETNPSITTPELIETKPSVTTPELVGTKPEIIKPVVTEESRKPIHNKYAFKTDTNEGGRWHALEVSVDGKASSDFKQRYQGQKGDHLKTSILEHFREQIEKVPNDAKKLDELEARLTNSEEYKILAKAQGVVSRMFHMETSAVAAFKEMIAEKRAQIPEQEANTSIQHR